MREVWINETVHRDEAALVFLGRPLGAERAGLLGDEVGRDARTVAPGDAHLLPGAVAVPLVVEPAALAERRGQGDEPAARYGEHRPYTAIERVRNAGCLVEDQQAHAAEGADRSLAPRQALDA